MWLNGWSYHNTNWGDGQAISRRLAVVPCIWEAYSAIIYNYPAIMTSRSDGGLCWVVKKPLCNGWKKSSLATDSNQDWVEAGACSSFLWWCRGCHSSWYIHCTSYKHPHHQSLTIREMDMLLWRQIFQASICNGRPRSSISPWTSNHAGWKFKLLYNLWAETQYRLFTTILLTVTRGMDLSI